MLEIVKRALAALVEKRNALHAELGQIAATAETEQRAITPDEDTRALAIEAELGTLDADIAAHSERVAELERIEERATAAEQAFAKAGLQVIKRPEPAKVADVRSMSTTQLVDQVRRGAEGRDIDPTHAAKIMRKYGSERHQSRPVFREWMENLAARSTDAYVNAFSKVFMGDTLSLTDEERAAVAVGTNTQGGFLVPTHLDPTIIITNTGTMNVIRQLARVETLVNGNVWKGISSAGVSASFDAELAEVSDDSPSFAQPTVTLYTARCFVQSSIEAVMDSANSLEGEVLNMFSDARDRLEAAKHCTGTGTAEPWGIFIAITGSQSTVSTTAATIGLVDILAVKTALKARWRPRSSWVYNPVWGDAIRQLGTAMNASYTVDATGANADRLVGRPAYETDDGPTAATTTTKDPELILGDFSNFVIADKPGSFAVQYVPTLFNTSNNLPDGRVGWFAYWRTGSDSVNDAAFQVLLDKTSA